MAIASRAPLLALLALVACAGASSGPRAPADELSWQLERASREAVLGQLGATGGGGVGGDVEKHKGLLTAKMRPGTTPLSAIYFPVTHTNRDHGGDRPCRPPQRRQTGSPDGRAMSRTGSQVIERQAGRPVVSSVAHRRHV